MTDKIEVMAVADDSRVVLWERHPDHPNGEIYITGANDTHTVVLTVAVQQKLNRGELRQVNEAVSEVVEITTDTDETFDVNSATIADVLGAVANDEISAEDALTQELEGKQRSTLIVRLEEMIDGGNADDR